MVHQWWHCAFILLLLVIIPILFSVWIENVPLYDITPIPQDAYWGAGEGKKDNEQIGLFSVDIPQEKIMRLKDSATRDQLLSPPEDLELPISRHLFMKNLSQVLVSFNWVQHQNFLNTFKQYKTDIEGLFIHFLRVSIPKQAGKDTVPIVLLHGFPGSYWDFYKVIPILVNPARFGFQFGVKRDIMFDVIVPSLPGFIFSTKPSKADFIVRIPTLLPFSLFPRIHPFEGLQTFAGCFYCCLKSRLLRECHKMVVGQMAEGGLLESTEELELDEPKINTINRAINRKEECLIITRDMSQYKTVVLMSGVHYEPM